jgi:hypothetical protein
MMSRFSSTGGNSEKERITGMNIASERNILTPILYGAGGRHFSVLYFSGRSRIPYLRRTYDTPHTISGEQMIEAINIENISRKNGIVIKYKDYFRVFWICFSRISDSFALIYSPKLARRKK